jgi:transposase InsO family protein
MVGCDAVGPVVPSKGGNQYILVAVDYLTRWPMAMAVPNINEETTVKFLYKQVISYGVPNYLLTDRGSNFTSGYVRGFLSSLGCKHITTTAYRPQTNGLCERNNQFLTQVLAKLVRDKDVEANWDEYLDEALFAMRTMVNDATGYSPSRLLYGYELVSPGIWPSPREDFVEGELVESVVERIKAIKNGVVECRAVARARTIEKQKERKKRYDKTVGTRKRFEVGEQVLLKDPVPSTKFADKWLGPMVVVRVNQKGTYWLDGPNGRRLDGAVNGDVLKPYIARKSMVPDVATREAIDRYETWVERKRK